MKLLRIEGVNLDYTISDTEDLSTRRGGSLMLLSAIDTVTSKFFGRLKPISTGASAGLFEVLGNADVDALVAEVRKTLTDSPLYRHGTFVVNTADGDFRPGSEKVLTANRWQQMQSLSFSGAGLKARHGPACKIDDLRPAFPGGPEDPANSLSVQARRQHGRKQKQDFYKHLLADGIEHQYTNDFEGLAQNMNREEDKEKNNPLLVPTPNLEGKMAVFYADGNAFGAVGRGCKTTDELKTWDTYIKDRRKQLLAAIIDHASKDPRWQTATGELRIETLLWGGDELMFVVPGWCGMALADLFFQQTTGQMHYPPGNKEALTHACGLVFCHHKAPISAISKLAKSLADKSKEEESAFKGKDSLNWVVLESFDQAGSQLDQFLITRYHNKLRSWDQLTLTPKAVHHLAHDLAHELAHELATLKDSLPRSTMVRALRMIVEGADFDKTKDQTKEPLRLLPRSYENVTDSLSKPGVDKASFCQLWQQLHHAGKAWDAEHGIPSQSASDDLSAWVKLLELWDYCQSPKCPTASVATPIQTKEPT